MSQTVFDFQCKWMCKSRRSSMKRIYIGSFAKRCKNSKWTGSLRQSTKCLGLILGRWGRFSYCYNCSNCCLPLQSNWKPGLRVTPFLIIFCFIYFFTFLSSPTSPIPSATNWADFGGAFERFSVFLLPVSLRDGQLRPKRQKLRAMFRELARLFPYS